MANWAIAIGVNQYEFLHPLKYAKNDALHICNFLENEAKFDRIFYFSDDSPDFDGRTTKPFRNNLLRVFNGLATKPLRDGDNFWFFFAGHGILGNDGIDYLMPSDGDLDNLVETGISVNRVIQNLRLSGAGNVILALDACRNQARRNGATRSGEGIGRETEREAKIADMISITACSPLEYSYEIDDIEHGAFTYALVEGLGVQGRCATAAKLNTYLKRRVPELAKTKQTPRMLLDPMEKGHLILMPKYADKSDLAPLRADAYQAFSYGKWDVAKRLWMQILAVDGANHEAIEQIERIVQMRYLGNQQVSDVANSPEISMRQVNARTVAERQTLNIDFDNSGTLELVMVPAGKFMMGSPNGEGDDDERPQHQVILQEFLIGKYAVTNAQWQAVMGTNPSEKFGDKFIKKEHPVVNVNWHEAKAFCQTLADNTRRDVRLPTEAEWEYSARGANISKGFMYSGSNNLDEVGWYGEKRNHGSTHSVGKKKPNEIGLYDMSGNVSEWCLDQAFSNSYRIKSDYLKSHGNEVIRDKNDNGSCIVRGGSWSMQSLSCRSTVRFANDSYTRSIGIGFRIVLAFSS